MIIMCIGIGVENSCLLLVHVHDILFFFIYLFIYLFNYLFFFTFYCLAPRSTSPNYHANAAKDQVNG